jgi:ribosomal protein L37E
VVAGPVASDRVAGRDGVRDRVWRVGAGFVPAGDTERQHAQVSPYTITWFWSIGTAALLGGCTRNVIPPAGVILGCVSVYLDGKTRASAWVWIATWNACAVAGVWYWAECRRLVAGARDFKQRKAKCSKCGFDLGGTPSGVCPECNTANRICARCGYDLTHKQEGQCPECGCGVPLLAATGVFRPVNAPAPGDGIG